jgi:hypothetical protein
MGGMPPMVTKAPARQAELTRAQLAERPGMLRALSNPLWSSCRFLEHDFRAACMYP